MSFFSQFSASEWFILSAVLLVLEIFVSGVLLIWFSAAAFVLALLLLFGLPLTPLWQLAAFVVFSIPFLFLGFRLQKRGSASSSALNRETEALIGSTTIASVDFTQGKGRIELGGTLFRAEGGSGRICAGDRLVVTGFRGNTALVERSALDDGESSDAQADASLRE